MDLQLDGKTCPGAATFQPSPQLCAVVSLISQKLLGCFGSTDNALGQWTIVRLAAAQKDVKKTAFSIGDCGIFVLRPPRGRPIACFCSPLSARSRAVRLAKAASNSRSEPAL